MSDVPNIPDDALYPKSIVDWEVKHGIVIFDAVRRIAENGKKE